MRFLHLGDLHLGKSLGDFDLIRDQAYILDQILDIAKEKKADALLIAGDVYDKSVPSEAAVNLLDSFLEKLAKERIKAFIISGNHDSDDRLHYGSRLFEANGIYIRAKYEGRVSHVEMEDSFGKLKIFMLPFIKASQVRHYFPDEKIDGYEEAVRAAFAHEAINPSERNILIAHQFVVGASDPVLAGSEGPSAQSVGTVEKIGVDAFKIFDYVALGHIHSPQKVGREEVRYAGSPLKYSLNEAMGQKSVPVVTLAEKGDVQIELSALKPLRDLRHIRGPMRKLLDKSHIEDPEDFIYATLTDEDFIPDAASIFREYYPNTVKIDYDNARTKEIGQVSVEDLSEGKSFGELIADFYQLIYGVSISEKEAVLMEQVAKEAGL